MSENSDAPADGFYGDTDDDPAGTNCALCGTDISPNQYWSCRAILVDESGSGGDEEAVKMVCQDCWAELDGELTRHSE